jgi:hypothetical protein
VTWLLKRLPLPQFRAHRFLQRTICWFCRNFVSPEANLLILRHFATESNILNFLRDNSNAGDVQALQLYPQKIDDLLELTAEEYRDSINGFNLNQSMAIRIGTHGSRGCASAG